MNKRNLLSFLFVLAIGFSSCDDNTDNSDTPTVRLVKQIDLFYKERGITESYECNYNSQNQLISISVNVEHNQTATFTYLTNNTLEFAHETGSTIWELNSDGSVASRIHKDINGHFLYEITSEYNDGYLEKDVKLEKDVMLDDNDNNMLVTFIKRYTWENGNVKLQGIDLYEYSSILNKPSSIDLAHCLIFRDMPIPFGSRGKSTKNLPSKVPYYWEQTFDEMLTYCATYRYTIDRQGYVTQVFSKEKDGIEYLMMNIQYK
ncbi:MAG: hypothetical protein FWD60_10795 [Candidatus Azobacteroides sp.]|nr:hypothetical protein [Candidatus Azobacteroides sp.]